MLTKRCINELTTYNQSDMNILVSWLLRNDYAVLVTKEDCDLYVINWELCEDISDRNQVVFMSVDEFDERFCEREEDERNDD